MSTYLNYFISEEVITDGKGIIRTFITSKTLFFDNANNKFLVGVSNDITQRKTVGQELQKRNDELEIFQKLVVGRELKMIELKKEINELAKKLGEDSDRYVITI